MMREHVLKTEGVFFDDVVSGLKKFEWRKNDRNFQLGDQIRLLRLNESGVPDGNSLLARITYILGADRCGKFGMPTDYVIIGFDCETDCIDFNAVSLAAGGDWWMELINSDDAEVQTDADIYLAIIRALSKENKWLRGLSSVSDAQQ